MKITDVPPQVFSLDFDASRLKIISGGQNGADQAGLRAARFVGIATGGWAPQGWATLDGPQKELLGGFGLVEASEFGYAFRTHLNARDSDITFRLAADFGSSGERCTYKGIIKHKKPFLDFDVPKDLSEENAIRAAEYVAAQGYRTINIAGNAEKTAPGIGKQVEEFLKILFTYLKNS